MTDPQSRTDDSVEVEETSAGSFGDAASEMANETEVEGGEPEAAQPEAAQPEVEARPVEQQLEERTADLQRLQAEYLNYKKRVERDRDLVRENATYQALAPIIDVLDNIDRAREHGPLDDGFRGVAEQLERILAGVGLVKFGAVGDPFDPMFHQALSHIGEDPDVRVTSSSTRRRSSSPTTPTSSPTT